MNIRVTDDESDFCKQVSAILFLRGQLLKPTVSALVREALRVYLNSVWIERDVFVSGPTDKVTAVTDWPLSHDIPMAERP